MAEHYQLKCRECGKLWGNQARSFCDECLSPLEVTYDLEAIRPIFTRKNIESGPNNLWRYSAHGFRCPEGFEGTLPTRVYAYWCNGAPPRQAAWRAVSLCRRE